MKSVQINRGFSRLALALLVPSLISALFGLSFWLYALATMPHDKHVVTGPNNETFEFPANISLGEKKTALERHFGRALREEEIRGHSSQMWKRQEAANALIWLVSSLVFGVVAWSVVRATGWIVAGFAND